MRGGGFAGGGEGGFGGGGSWCRRSVSSLVSGHVEYAVQATVGVPGTPATGVGSKVGRWQELEVDSVQVVARRLVVAKGAEGSGGGAWSEPCLSEAWRTRRC